MYVEKVPIAKRFQKFDISPNLQPVPVIKSCSISPKPPN